MRNYLYKLIIDDVTGLCYKNCLNYFPDHSRILDVGIGNGIMIRRFHNLIRTKGLRITGIDINSSYLKHCSTLISQWQLEDHIEIFHTPVECYEPPAQEFFDFILFSMSFMLFRDQPLVLDRIRPWLRPGGRVLFFQTMFRRRSFFMEFIKPKLKYLTTVDFGRVTYRNDFAALMDRKHLSITEDRLIKRNWFKGEYHLVISALENGMATRAEKFALKKRDMRTPHPIPNPKGSRLSHLDQT